MILYVNKINTNNHKNIEELAEIEVDNKDDESNFVNDVNTQNLNSSMMKFQTIIKCFQKILFNMLLIMKALF